MIEDGTADMIANGALVEVEGKLSGGILSATKVEIEHVTVITLDGTVPSVQGTISSFVSVANFIVAGQQINAGTASFVGGSSANLGNGVRVSVAGTVSNGVLNATTVQFLSSPGPSTVTVTGAISGFISVSNFTIAGQRIDASSASFSNGNASNLANGRSVTVTGTVQSGTANRRSQRLQSRRRPRGDRSAARSASLRSSPPSWGATIRSSSMPGHLRGPPCRSRSFARRRPSSRSPSSSTTVRRCFRKWPLARLGRRADRSREPAWRGDSRERRPAGQHSAGQGRQPRNRPRDRPGRALSLATRRPRKRGGGLR